MRYSPVLFYILRLLLFPGTFVNPVTLQLGSHTGGARHVWIVGHEGGKGAVG